MARTRTRRPSREPGTALCAAVAAASLGVLARWSLRAWITPFVGGSPWIYGARILHDCASWCGLGVLAALTLLIPGRGCRRRGGWIEWLRWTRAAYWLAVFAIFGIL